MEAKQAKPSKFLRFLLFLAIAVGGFYVLDTLGLSPATRSETTEWVDTKDAINRADEFQPTTQKNEYTLETEKTLRAIANRFANGENFTSSPAQHLSADEARFYNKVKAKNSLEKASDWFSVLQSSHSTYQKVKGFLDTESGETPSFYKKLEQDFDIPSSAIESFQSQGEHLASDWALWLMEQQ